MTTTQTVIRDWQDFPLQGAGELYDQFKNDPEFLEYTADIEPDELLRLAVFGWNDGASFVPEDMPLLISQEWDAFQGEFDSAAAFAEDFFESTGQIDSETTKWLVIDWEATYYYALQFDFFKYKIKDTEGNYRMFFWSANA